MLDLTLVLESTESNPQLVQIVPPNEVVVVVGFELKMGGRVGTMSLCVPFNAIEPVMAQLSNQTWLNYRRRGAKTDSAAQISKRIEGAPVKMRAILAQTTITVSDLAGLAVGDTIATGRSAGAEIVLQVEGRSKFAARLGEHKGKKALKITRELTPGQRV